MVFKPKKPRKGLSLERRTIRFFKLIKKKPLGNDLLSQEVALQVPSALTALTTGFEMLPGIPLSLQSPRDFIHLLILPINYYK